MKLLRKFFLLVLFVSSGAICFAQDVTNLGGALTSDLPPKAAVTLPSPNVASAERFGLHLDGFVAFNRSFLFDRDSNNQLISGPRLNNDSCAGCHLGDGKGAVGFDPKAQFSTMIVKVGFQGLEADGSAREVPGIGRQIQDRTPDGEQSYDLKLRWAAVRGYLRDRTRFELRKPILTFDSLGLPPAQRRRVVHSLRMAPALIGMGLLEAVPDEAIIAGSDPEDLDGDGISGRVNYVPSRTSSNLEIGRFGFKATHPTVIQQTASAFFHDMGITNSLFSPGDGSYELSDAALDVTVKYLQFAGVPRARKQDDPKVRAGKILFQKIGCAACHTMTLVTGPSSVPEVANQVIHPFTDLLLHDMGPELADNRPEYGASGREWRTTPLWGLGILSQLNREKIRYLHDGRARTVTEAILWHGGEARVARERFKRLRRAEREQLLLFLNSI